MFNKNNIIEYQLTLKLLLYSILIYKLDKNVYNELTNITLDELFDKHNENLTSILKKYIISKSKNDKILKFFYCDKTHIYCMLIEDKEKKHLKFIFKGSSDNIHLKYNIKIKLKNINFLNNNKIKIHTGFYQQIFQGKLYQKIIEYLNDMNLDNYMFFYSGHSLGGVMATLFGYFMSYLYHKNKIIITSFGGSKIGNNFFKESFENKKNIICYRFINDNDFITQLPIINYEHVGIEIKLKSNNNINLLEDHSYNTYLYNLLEDRW